MIRPAPVAPGVRRMTAPNPSPMTAAGTNAYLIGGRRAVLIDPGPDDPAWRAQLLAALGPEVELVAILVTHSHRDHSPGAAPISAETGAPTLAFGPHGAGQSATMARLAAEGGAEALGGGEGADRAFSPDRRLSDGEVAVEEDGFRLTALHTPGHLGNHLSFALEIDAGGAGAGRGEGRTDRILFSGDHVMGWATSLVSPPDGDMGAFMASLDRLATRQAGRQADRIYLPGHGDPVADPSARVAELIAHRRAREAQVLAALAEGPATAAALAARIYREVDPRLLPMAARNVLSHLIDLTERGLAAPDGEPSAAAAFRAA
ncbi:MAG: MBL fold metallo-hydrolase [Pseudomonadota bacterium]